MLQAIIIISLLWLAVTLPFKMKGWLGGAVMGFVNKNVAGAAKKGLKYGKEVGMAKMDKIAANKGTSTPWGLLKGYREKGKKEWENAQGLNVAAGRDKHTMLWKQQPGQERLREYERLEKAAEADFGEYDEEADQALRAQIGTPKDLSDRVKLTALTKRAMKARNLNDDMEKIYTSHENGEHGIRDKMLKSYNFKDYADFKTKVMDVDGGVVGQNAIMNICEQLHRDEDGNLSEDGLEKATRLGSWYSQWSLANGQSHTTHLTTIGADGKVKWNHGAANAAGDGYDWSKQAEAAAAEEAKVDPQANMRNKSYQAVIKIKPVYDPATGESSNRAYGDPTDELVASLLSRPDSFIAGYLGQAGRINPEQRDALVHQVPGAGGVTTNTLRELLKVEKAQKPAADRKLYNEIKSYIDAKKTDAKAIDFTKDGTAALLRDAGMMKVDAANVGQGTDALFNSI